LILSAVHGCIIHHPALFKLPKQSHIKSTQLTSHYSVDV